MLTEVAGALPSPKQAPMPGLRTQVIQVVVTQVRKILYDMIRQRYATHYSI